MPPSPAHHAPGGGFRNPWPLPPDAVAETDVPFWRALRWGLGFAARARRARRPVPFQRLDPAALAAPVAAGTVRVAWLGHTALLLQYPGATVLTDPMLGRRASPFAFLGPRRETPPPIDPAALPRVDVVLLSHDHYDHLDVGSVRALHRRDRPLFAAPLGVGARLRSWMPDVRVVEVDWGGVVAPEGTGLTVTATPARHFSGRTPFDRDSTLWASYWIDAAGGPSVYFGADSGYAPHFAEIGHRHGAPDLALLPIGAYAPRWFMRPVHVDPDEAVQAAVDLGARLALGTHWGVFVLSDEPMDEPPRRFLDEAARRGVEARVLPVGGTPEVAASGRP